MMARAAFRLPTTLQKVLSSPFSLDPGAFKALGPMKIQFCMTTRAACSKTQPARSTGRLGTCESSSRAADLSRPLGCHPLTGKQLRLAVERFRIQGEGQAFNACARRARSPSNRRRISASAISAAPARA